MKCCICGKTIEDKWGNNPYPVKNEGRCCSECNWNVVIPARLEKIYKEKAKNKEEK